MKWPFARVLWIALVAVLALPASGQEEEVRPFFALSSNETYLPGEKGNIQVWVQNVNTLEFRVYRVNDPIAFFEKLGELHNFGGQSRPLRRELTWLEEFHAWKRGWRYRIRDFFRAQFTAESRAAIRDWMQGQPTVRGPLATPYAQVPVLNQQQLVSTWKQNFVAPKYRWESQTVSVALPSKGLFLVEAVHHDERAYTILMVTELGLVLKTGPGRIVAFAQNRVTGKPVAEVPVRFWVDRKEVAQQPTDANGLADASVEEERPDDAVVLAKLGDDFAVSSTYAWYLGMDPERFWVGYIYTDRPVYRPTHTVHFKGVLRTQAGITYSIPAGRVVEAEIQDPEGTSVYRKELPVSAMGTVHGSFEVPGNARLGYYSLVLRSGEARSHGGFHVEEYRKPEYEVRVLPEVRRVLQGDAITAKIEARYYFGEPVAGAKVTWVVHRSTYWLYPQEEDEEEYGEEESQYDYGGEQVLEETGELDPDGRITIRIPTRVSDKKNDLRYRIEARVTDAAGREINGHSFVLATYASFALQIQPRNYVYGPGDRAKFDIAARDYDNQPVRTSVRVSLQPWRWRQGEQAAVFTTQVATNAEGKAEVEIPLAAAGSYYAQASATSPENREVQDRTYVWVTGGDVSWYGRASEQVQIVPDKPSYRPGDTARLLVVTGKPGIHALVTTEGNHLYGRQVVSSDAATFTVEVPIRSEFAPNVFVSVAFLRDNQLYEGSKRIKVPPDERKIQIDIASKAQYSPGEPATVSLTARDHLGRPVAGEFSLGVVDEAIYAIRPDTTTDILNFFYGRQYNRVSTQTSLTYYFRGVSSKRAMLLAARVPGGIAGGVRGRLAQLKPSALVDPRVRKAFPDTAHWVAELNTDASGQATARFTFPDALTTWRFTARGITADSKVGSAVHRTLVRKNVILRQATPRFFRQGDEVVSPSIVHNYLTTDKTARVSLEATGVQIAEGQTRDVAVPSRGEAEAAWRLRSPAPGNATLLAKALTDEESDAVELTLPVVPYGVKLSAASSGSLSGVSQAAETQVVFPEKIEPRSRTLEVSVSPSLAGALFGALDYLTTFPYGCTEQTMSSFLPNIIVQRALNELGVKSNVDPVALEKKIKDGLERLYQFQHPDGGWGWWPTDESSAFMTAYVVAGLAQAREAGVTVDPRRLADGAKWLRSAFDREARALPDLRAYLAYSLALAGVKDAAVLDAVWARRDDLTPYGRALLGLALHAAGDRRGEELAAQLESQAVVDGAEAYWPADRDTLMDFYGDATPESTAHAVKLLSRLRPSSPVISKAVTWLLNHRNEGYYWYSTKQTAMVIHGITDYLKASGELKPDYSFTVEVNGREALSRRFTAADATALDPPTVRLPAAELAAGTNQVHIRKRGRGVLYWSARGDYYSTDEKLSATGTVQLNLLREYFRMVPERDGEKIVYRIVPLEGEVALGDVLAVRLTVTGGTWRYLMIEDPIPAGTEFIERDDLYQIREQPSWWGFWYSRREFRDDRAVFFQTYFNPGQHQFLYLLKVTHRGTFRVSPARVQPMYQPKILATTEGRTLVVP